MSYFIQSNSIICRFQPTICQSGRSQKMNLKSGIKNLFIISGAVWGLSVAPAQAGVVGAITLGITNGCFSYGAGGATGCGNTDTSKLEYATGNFAFSNTLSGISNPGAYAYQAAITLHAEAPNNSLLVLDDSRSKSFDSLADLTSDPLWGTAFSFVNAVMANPTGSFSGMTPTNPPMGPYTVFWDYAADAGSFTAWSKNDLNSLSNIFLGQSLPPVPVGFTLNVSLAAVTVPEPAMLALIGLGVLGIGMTRRRKAYAYPAAI